MEEILASRGRYKENGITFVLAKPQDEERVWKFLLEEFMPDEPNMRSLGLTSSETWFDRLAQGEVKKKFVTHCLTGSGAASILAINKDEEIIGVKLGYATNVKDCNAPFGYFPRMKYLYWMLPQRLVNLNTASWYFEEDLRYHPKYAMEDLGVQSLFEGEVLGVGKKARGLGLGKEMLRMSIEIAKRQKCDVYFSCVSGIYSQKIYRDMGFTVMKELIYKDVKNYQGHEILNDTREHTKAQDVFLKLQ